MRSELCCGCDDRRSSHVKCGFVGLPRAHVVDVTAVLAIHSTELLTRRRRALDHSGLETTEAAREDRRVVRAVDDGAYVQRWRAVDRSVEICDLVLHALREPGTTPTIALTPQGLPPSSQLR